MSRITSYNVCYTKLLRSKAVQIGFAKWSITPLGLIGGFIAGYAFADLVMLKGVKKDIKAFKQVSIRNNFV